MWTIDSDRQKRVRIVALAALPLLLLALFMAGSQPFAVHLISVPYDKLAHCCCSRCSRCCSELPRACCYCNAVVCFCSRCVVLTIGLADELHQAFLPGRSAGWDDFACHAAGAVFGL